jgi:hypothetical protein
LHNGEFRHTRRQIEQLRIEQRQVVEQCSSLCFIAFLLIVTLVIMFRIAIMFHCIVVFFLCVVAVHLLSFFFGSDDLVATPMIQ